jgi:hypothetical protein
MADEKFEKLRRQNRRIILFLVALLIVNSFFIFLWLASKDDRDYSYVPIPGIAGIKGEKGEKGDDGDRGPQGLPGVSIVGPQGITGLPGLSIQGPPGPQGVTGKQGIQGEPGPQGEVGNPGAPGPAGRNREIRCNTETQQFESRLEGDEEWLPMEGSDCVANNRQE